MKNLLTALFAFSSIIASTASGQLKWDSSFVEVNASPEDADARLHFPFVNAGKYRVNFTAVVPACGCTTARLDKTLQVFSGLGIELELSRSGPAPGVPPALSRLLHIRRPLHGQVI